VKVFRFAVLTAILMAAGHHACAGTLTANFSLLGGNINQVSFIWNGNNVQFASGQEVPTRTDLPAGPGVDTLVPQNFHAFCVEINQPVYVGGASNTYANVISLAGATTQTLGDPSDNPVTFDPTRVLMLERLWGGFESTVTTPLLADAFQLAVWELAFDTDHTLTTGILRASAADLATLNSVANTAQGWLAQVANLNVSLPLQSLLLLTDPNVQDLITASPDSPHVPEPSTLALAGIALGSVAVGRWRSRRGR
jgi:hypothetical protein